MSRNNPLWEQDYALVQKTLSGDETAWKTLADSAGKKVLNVVIKTDIYHLLSREEQKDLAAEALLRCFERRALFDKRCRFSSWVCGYARFVTINFCKKRLTQLKQQSHFENLAKAQMYVRSNPLTVLMAKERQSCVWLVLNALPARERMVVFESQFCQRRFADIGKMCGLTRGQVMYIYENSLELLKTYFNYFYHVVPFSKNF